MKTIITPNKTLERKMYCSHVRCKTITQHTIKYIKSVFENRQGEWNIIFKRCCLSCTTREPKENFEQVDIITCSNWNALVSKDPC